MQSICTTSHMHRMSIMAMAVPNSDNVHYSSVKVSLPRFDSGKLVKMCLIHDVIECIAGDITPRKEYYVGFALVA